MIFLKSLYVNFRQLLFCHYLYHKNDNITYIANGMGSNKNDNIIIVGVDQDDQPHFKLLGLNADVPFEIENLEEFILP